MSRFALVAVLLVAAFVLGRGGQAQRLEHQEYDFHPLDSKQLARDKFALQFAKLEDIARAKLEAARLEQDARLKEFMAGRGTLDNLESAFRRVLDAELALADTPTTRVAAHERYWRLTREIEAINQLRYNAGTRPITDLAQSRYSRLDAEYQLVRARAELEKK